MEEKKPVKSVETSASYIAWSLKELVIEMKKANDTLEKIALKLNDPVGF